MLMFLALTNLVNRPNVGLSQITQRPTTKYLATIISYLSNFKLKQHSLIFLHVASEYFLIAIARLPPLTHLCSLRRNSLLFCQRPKYPLALMILTRQSVFSRPKKCLTQSALCVLHSMEYQSVALEPLGS
jgi:hypothetical protein